MARSSLWCRNERGTISPRREWQALQEAVAAGPCKVYTDGMTVRIDEHGSREPDALLSAAAIIYDAMTLEPVVVVEVVADRRRRDSDKLVEDF